jgi:hypothetical protein
MDATRATLLAILAAVGLAAPAVGQWAGSDPPAPPLPPPYDVPAQPRPTYQPVNVLPPRPMQMPTLPLLPNRTGGLIRSTQYVSPTVEATGQPISVDAGGSGQTAWLAAPVGAEAGTSAPASNTDWNSPATYAPNGRPSGGSGTTWRWHGYGAASPGPVTARRTANATANYAPAYIPPEATPQPATPLPMPTPQQTHMTPLPMPSTLPPTEIGSPTAAPYSPGSPMPPMAPPVAPSAPPPNASAALEPTWRAAGTQFAANTPVANSPEPWVAASTRQDAVMRALYASNGWPYPVTARAVSEAPTAPRQAVQQASATFAAPASNVAMGAPSARPPATQTRFLDPPPTRTATAAARPPAPAADTPYTRLRARVEQACAGKGRELELYSRGPGSLLVRVKVAKAADAELVANRISQLPELAPYRVSFEMRVGQ